MNDPIKLLTWNLSYFQGEGSEGINYHRHSEAEFRKRIRFAAQIINEFNPDVVMLQEVDFHSRRSYFIEEGKTLSAMTPLKHSSNCVSWDCTYVPFPFWPPTQHFGRVQSGGLILSRHPIDKTHISLLPKPEENLKLYNYFYPSRYLHATRITINLNHFWFVNLHLEAFSKSNRKQHLLLLEKFIHSLDTTYGESIIVAGDFNTAIRAQDFSTDFNSLYKIISPDSGTYPAKHPSDTLDHFIVPTSTHVLQSSLLPTPANREISDHLCFSTTIQIDPT